MSATVQQGQAGMTPIKTRPRQPRKKNVSTSNPLDTSALEPTANDLLRLTPSKRKLILLREEGDENSPFPCSPKSRVKTIDAEEAQESLCRGATRGDAKAIQKAIASGASVSTPNCRGMTPLMQCAAAQGATAAEALQFLVEHGSAIDALDKNGWTALHHACRSGKSDSAKYLASVSADPSLVTGDELRQTALMLAAMDAKSDLVTHLLKQERRVKDQISLQDTHGWTALHYAMKNGSKDTVKILLDQGAKTRVRCSEGHQPFMTACDNGKLECAKLLISTEKNRTQSIDINAEDNHNRTALLLACLNRHDDVALWLVRKCKADWRTADRDGHSAVAVARAEGMTKVLGFMHNKKDADGVPDANLVQ